MTPEAMRALVQAQDQFARVRRELAGGGPLSGAIVALLQGLALGAGILLLIMLSR